MNRRIRLQTCLSCCLSLSVSLLLFPSHLCPPPPWEDGQEPPHRTWAKMPIRVTLGVRALISHGCLNTSPQTWWLETTEMYFQCLWRPEVKNQSVPGAMLCPKAAGDNPFCLFQLLLVVSSILGLRPHAFLSASLRTWPPPLVCPLWVSVEDAWDRPNIQRDSGQTTYRNRTQPQRAASCPGDQPFLSGDRPRKPGCIESDLLGPRRPP